MQEAFAASLALHVLAAWLAVPTWSEQTAAALPRPPLTVTLAAGPTIAPTTTLAGDKTDPLPPADAGTARADDTILEKARLLRGPDLYGLQEIPVTVAGVVRLRLFVTAAGTVEKVAVRRSDPIPTALLEGLQRQFKQTALQPALSATGPVPSTLDIDVRFEPLPDEDAQSPSGKGNTTPSD